MASTSDSHVNYDKNSTVIDQFCSVTGSTREKAIKMLEVCNWNLEMAVNMHVDSDFQEAECNGPSTENPDLPVNAEVVRPPIPPSRSVLVEEDVSINYGLRGRKRRPFSVFDGFRDFQAEAQLEELSAENSESIRKRRTLEDLFRPPLDIMHRGSFESAKDSGQMSNRWLMVNIQDSQEFSCQVLNRDVWSNPEVKNVIRKHFIFWQVYSDSVEGQRYIQFYKPIEFPYIAVLDPRTGEKLVEWHKLESATFFELVSLFLKEYYTPNGSKEDVDESCFNVLDQSEEFQLKAALAASLKDSMLVNVEDDDSELETFDSDSESDCKVVKSNSQLHSENSSDTIDVVGFSESNDKKEFEFNKSYKNFLGGEDDPKTELVIRFPDGKREQITWPCTTKMKALLLYIGELGFDPDKYELVTNYPRRNLCQLDLSQSLKDVDLFPREMVFVQLKT